MPVQMIGQRLAAVLARCLVFSRKFGRLDLFVRGLRNHLIFFEGQIELIQALGTHTKSVAVLTCQLMLELLDQERLRFDFIGQKPVHGPQFCRVFWRDIEVLQHRRSYTGSGTKRESRKQSRCCICYSSNL